MKHTYIIYDTGRDVVIMLTVFPGNDTVRVQENCYDMGANMTRKSAASWLRYWRRCGWKVWRVC